MCTHLLQCLLLRHWQCWCWSSLLSCEAASNVGCLPEIAIAMWLLLTRTRKVIFTQMSAMIMQSSCCPAVCPLVVPALAALQAAPTVILQQLFDQDLGRPMPSAPSRSMLVWPVKGTYCLFDGRLGHGVLDSCSGSIRATLLVNWWSKCPQVGGND